MHTKPHTKESKAKISDAMKGNKNRLGFKSTDKQRWRHSIAIRKWHKKK